MSNQHKVPNPARSVLRPALVAAMIGVAFVSPAVFAAFNSGSTGTDGALAPTVNTEIQVPPSGILNYTSINIPAGVTVKFKKNALNTPVYLLVGANVSIAGFIDIRGGDAPHSGTSGDGNQADDGIAGVGAAGGFDGGRGGRDDVGQRPEIIRGGSGLGPGGGKGGIEGAEGCTGTRYFKHVGIGAAYATNGGTSWWRPGRCNGFTPDQPKAYGSTILQPMIGGSGGGGGRGGANYPGSGGGGGGGALVIAASGTISLAATGTIDATGGDAGASAGTNAGGQGGGGSGGGIRLIATTITGNGPLNASGGCANSNNVRRQSCLDSAWDGLGAAPGRIRLEAEAITYSGTSLPLYTTDIPGPIFLSSLPGLRIASIGGSAVPANPTGSADLTFPATVVNPVTVDLTTSNVPTGNTVLVKVIPAYGEPQEVLSAAITGSAASGNASVQVTLPQGPSVIQATTTYTVVVAMGEALSRFAQNERVEKVQLLATLGREGQAKLITVSGKEFLVPMSVLQMVGFTG